MMMLALPGFEPCIIQEVAWSLCWWCCPG